MKKSIYKHEINVWKKQRKSYIKKLEELHMLYTVWAAQKSISMGYSAENGMLDIIELIDTGFLRADAFDVKTYFGDYQAVYYYGAYPFTEKGIRFLHENRKARTIRRASMILGIAILFIISIIALTC